MSGNEVLVSIVTPTFNSLRYIDDVYQCIKEQTYSNWEWIVVDDMSSDGTVEYMRSIAAEDSRVFFFENTSNHGAAYSRNIAIDNARGEFVCFLDSDDFWVSNKLEKQVMFMSENQYDFSFTAYSLIDANGVSLNRTVDTTSKQKISYPDHLKKVATLGCSTVMLSRHIIGETRMPDLRSGQDYAFWLKILKKNCSAYLLPEILTFYRITPGSISRNKIKKACRQWQIYRDVEKISLLRSCYYFFWYAFRAIFRKS